jgi:threonine synthase
MTVVVAPRVRFPIEGDVNPFVRYRALFHSYDVARAGGMSDAQYVEIVRGLDAAIAGVDGHGFAVTPLARSAAASDRLNFTADGGVWVKDETGNVSGSHKARHLMGLAILLEVVERLGLGARRVNGARTLAIASCGNAALAAAVVARAVGRPLDVFIPTSADPNVVVRLERLGARLTVCARQDGVPGDPTYRRLRQALAGGALPFTCQGSDNGLTIEGGKTLGYEIAGALVARGGQLDRLFVQVGGGALASAVIQGLQDARRLGAPVAMPRLHAVQTRGAHPLKRAYDRLADRIVDRLTSERGPHPLPSDGDQGRAELIRTRALTFTGAAAVAEELLYAATHRSAFMWPWEQEPKSIAHGILDDETYDWLAVVRGMLETGGYPVVVSEETLVEANDLARAATGIDVDHTGSAGLAGLLHLQRGGTIQRHERVAVLFTGARR